MMPAPVHLESPLPASLPLDEKRGTAGMLLFILSEALLFACLFFSYFYLGRDEPRWPMHPPPALTLVTVMLAVLLLSSAVLYFGERALENGHNSLARLAVIGTLLLAAGFVVLQVFEYRNHLQELKPTTDAYGSIFYTITSFHALHLLLGMGMLTYVLFLPALEHADRPPHRSLHNTALYWHFVDLVWIFIVAVLYYAPHGVR
jgi:heme/copper-type cytochrome/quinol oxidase subunit 3